MNEPIKSEEKDLHDVILDLFNISCIEIPKFYIEKRHNNPALKVIEDFEKNKQAILKNILDEIMKDESGKTAFAISPQIFLERFTNYRLVKNMIFIDIINYFKYEFLLFIDLKLFYSF
jgi:hypothetical protein